MQDESSCTPAEQSRWVERDVLRSSLAADSKGPWAVQEIAREIDDEVAAEDAVRSLCEAGPGPPLRRVRVPHTHGRTRKPALRVDPRPGAATSPGVVALGAWVVSLFLSGGASGFVSVRGPGRAPWFGLLARSACPRGLLRGAIYGH